MASHSLRRIVKFIAMSYSVALGAACSSPTSSAAGTTDANQTADATAASEFATYASFVAAYAKAHCARQMRCDAKPKSASVEACLAAISPEIQRQRSAIDKSVDAGKTAYHQATAAACLTKVESACSTAFLDVLKACNPVINGLVAAGQACVGHYECLRDPLATGSGPYCFNACKGVQGSEDPPQTGICGATSPIGTAACP